MEITCKNYQMTEVGLIPKDWNVKLLMEICSPAKARINPLTATESYKCVELEHLSQETGRLLGYSDTKNLKSQKTVFQKNDILFGKLRPYLKKYLYAKFDGVCTTEIWVFKSPSNIDNKWLYYLVQSNRIIEAANQSTGTKMPRAEWKTVGNTPIPLPSTKSEQSAIASALSGIDTLIENLEKLIAKKRDIKKGVMQELLTGRKRLAGFKGNWETKLLGDISDINTGKKNNDDKIEEGLYPFFVRSQTIERINSYSFDGEAILIPGEGNIGSIYHYINGKFDYHQRVYKISNFDTNICGKYIYYKMLHNFNAHAMKNTVKATVDSLRLPTFQRFEVYLPPDVEEQKAVANILSDIETEIEILREKLHKYIIIKQGMMQVLLTGKIRLS